MKFKVGDEVEIIKSDKIPDTPYIGLTGTIERMAPVPSRHHKTHGKFKYTVGLTNSKSARIFDSEMRLLNTNYVKLLNNYR